jgi:hypothetical protein
MVEVGDQQIPLGRICASINGLPERVVDFEGPLSMRSPGTVSVTPTRADPDVLSSRILAREPGQYSFISAINIFLSVVDPLFK